MNVPFIPIGISAALEPGDSFDVLQNGNAVWVVNATSAVAAVTVSWTYGPAVAVPTAGQADGAGLVLAPGGSALIQASGLNYSGAMYMAAAGAGTGYVYFSQVAV